MNITKTVEKGFCVSCEICDASCPFDAIDMIYECGQFLPKVDFDKCTNCGFCLKVCPGIDIDFKKIHTNSLEETICGDPLEFYSAYCIDVKTLNSSTSGGVISTLTKKLLDDGKYSGAFLLHFETFDNQSARLSCFSKNQDITKCSGSKYIPVSVYNVIKELKQIKNPNYIIVGTPCQISGIKKFIFEEKINDKGLLFLGLFCDRTHNFNIIKYFETLYKKQNEKLTKIDFRNKEKDGWPGHVKLYFDSGREKIIDRKKRTEIKDFFQLERCLYCLDKLNINADISVGDCYIYGKSSPERSSVIIRTDRGKTIFDKYKHLFSIEQSSKKSILLSQGISNKKENFSFSCLSENYLDKKTQKKLKIRKKKILLGKHFNLSQIQKMMKKEKLLNKIKIILESINLIIIFIMFLICYSFKINNFKKRENEKENLIIVGGGFSNNGAQGMTFTLVDMLKKQMPNKNIFLFSNKTYMRDEAEKSIYSFEIKPWPPIGTKINLLSSLRTAKHKKITVDVEDEEDLRNILLNSHAMIDISGYSLSSRLNHHDYQNFITTLNYILNIMVAKKYDIPFFILPQSIGPFDYPPYFRLILIPLLSRYLKYPKKIYIREQQGIENIKLFKNKNVIKRDDIVLNTNGYDKKIIYKMPINIKSPVVSKNSVGIVPNTKIYQRTESKDFFSFYFAIIDKLLSLEKHVYIFRHSTEDFKICYEIKKRYQDNSNVIFLSDDYNCIEVESLIAKFDFIIASRYHSIIHAYRNNIPLIAIGWAKKYEELLKKFDQLDYFLDIENGLNEDKISDLIIKLNSNKDTEKEIIKEKLSSLSSHVESISFD